MRLVSASDPFFVIMSPKSSVADPGCLSQILIFIQQHPKKEGKNILLRHFL
jgi:hypothetical protein